MGKVVYTYLIATAAILVGAVGAALAGMNTRVEGMILMALGGVTFIVGVTFSGLRALRSAPRRRRPVTGSVRTRTWTQDHDTIKARIS